MRTFVNPVLIEDTLSFVTFVEECLSALLQRSIVHERAADVPDASLPEAILEGVCVDLVHAVQLRSAVTVDGARRDLPVDALTEFSYLLAAWADESLIRWFKERLPRAFAGTVEHSLFGTMDAGEQVFMRLERVLARQSQGDVALSGVYLILLALGFRGQYAEHAGNAPLRHYQQSLAALALSPVPTLPEPQAGGATSHEFAWNVLPDPNEASIAREAVRPGKRFVATLWRPVSLWTAVALAWIAAVCVVELAWQREVGPTRSLLSAAERMVPARVAHEVRR